MTAASKETARQAKTIDRLIALGMWSPALLAGLAIGNVAREHGQTKIFKQPRVGQFGKIFEIEKLRTEDGDTGRRFSTRAERIRQVGGDEWLQRINILDGDMRFRGWRPLVPEEHEEFMDALPPRLERRWKSEVLITPPGVLSTYGIRYHAGLFEDPNRYEQKAELDCYDENRDGLIHTARLIQQLVTIAVAGRLRNL